MSILYLAQYFYNVKLDNNNNNSNNNNIKLSLNERLSKS